MTTETRLDKVKQAIYKLPDAPQKRIYWIVYNEDMVKYTEGLIAELRGQEYLDTFVRVVPKNDNSKRRAKGTVYFDPGLYDLIGNGGT